MIIAVAIFVWLSMSNNIEKKIIGTWQNNTNKNLYITFLDGNNVSIDNDIVTLNGTYIFTGENSIKINLKAAIFEYIITTDISIKGGSLSFENINDNIASGTWLVGETKTSFDKIK